MPCGIFPIILSQQVSPSFTAICGRRLPSPIHGQKGKLEGLLEVIIRNVTPGDTEQWLSMRLALWPETTPERHRQEMAMMLSASDRYAVFVSESPNGSLIGFAEVSLREWAEGCLSSPVGYLEGWYVIPRSRGQGVGKALLSGAEDWARSRSCTEMASDTDFGNRAGEAAHLRLGFEVVGRLIAFRKDL